jgi:hypothetical protein
MTTHYTRIHTRLILTPTPRTHTRITLTTTISTLTQHKPMTIRTSTTIGTPMTTRTPIHTLIICTRILTRAGTENDIEDLNCSLYLRCILTMVKGSSSKLLLGLNSLKNLKSNQEWDHLNRNR